MSAKPKMAMPDKLSLLILFMENLRVSLSAPVSARMIALSRFQISASDLARWARLNYKTVVTVLLPAVFILFAAHLQLFAITDRASAQSENLLIELCGLSGVFGILRVFDDPFVAFEEARRVGIDVLADRNTSETDEHLLPLF
jgi:hypothetical protein